MIRGVVFDFDGVILDTETTLFEVWSDYYARYGATLPLERWVAIVGGEDEEGFDPWAYLLEQVDTPIDRDAIDRERVAALFRRLAAQEAMAGVRECMAHVRAAGLALGVASSSDTDWVEGHLGNLGLRHQVQAIACGDEVPRVKPDPALYRLAAERLGLAPEACIAIEDSHKGVTAAKAAGMFCIAVPNRVTAGLDLSAADYRAEALSVAQLRHWLEDAGARMRHAL